MTRHLQGVALTLATSALALALVGCGDAEESISSESPTAAAASPTVSPPPTEPTITSTPTRSDVRGLARSLVRATTGSFRSVTELVGGRVERSGEYDLDRLAHTLRADFEIGTESYSTDAVVVDNDFYFRFIPAGEEPSRCWSALSFDDLGPQIAESGVVSPTGGVRGIPPELLTLVNASVGADGRTRSDLYTTASVIGGKFTSALAIDPDADDTTPIEIVLDDDGSTSWSTDFATLLDSVAAAGATPDPVIETALAPGSTIESEVFDVGDAVSVQPPPERLVLRPTGDAAADQRALDECNGA